VVRRQGRRLAAWRWSRHGRSGSGEDSSATQPFDTTGLGLVPIDDHRCASWRKSSRCRSGKIASL
jgi:hypothetical protein